MAVPPAAEYDPTPRSERTTRWQGTTSGTRLPAMQLPAARAARGKPARGQGGVAGCAAIGDAATLVQDAALKIAQRAGVDRHVAEVIGLAGSVVFQAAFQPRRSPGWPGMADQTRIQRRPGRLG